VSRSQHSRTDDRRHRAFVFCRGATLDGEVHARFRKALAGFSADQLRQSVVPLGRLIFKRSDALASLAGLDAASTLLMCGELDIPRLRVSVMVFEGDDAGILGQGAGHIPGTALPAGVGNIGIAAHRDTYFRPLRVIHANDMLTLKTPAGTSRYAVTETKIVRPSAVGVLASAPGRDLTLVTCYPFSYVGSAPERFIVHARKIG